MAASTLPRPFLAAQPGPSPVVAGPASAAAAESAARAAKAAADAAVKAAAAGKPDKTLAAGLLPGALHPGSSASSQEMQQMQQAAHPVGMGNPLLGSVNFRGSPAVTAAAAANVEAATAQAVSAAAEAAAEASAQLVPPPEESKQEALWGTSHRQVFRLLP